MPINMGKSGLFTILGSPIRILLPENAILENRGNHEIYFTKADDNRSNYGLTLAPGEKYHMLGWPSQEFSFNMRPGVCDFENLAIEGVKQ